MQIMVSKNQILREEKGRLVVYIPMPIGNDGNTWLTIYSIPMTVVTANANRQSLILLLLGLLLSLVGVILLINRLGKLLEPLNDLRELASHAGAADFDFHNEVRQAATAIEKIQDQVTSINQNSATIASAVEEQAATTQELVRTISVTGIRNY